MLSSRHVGCLANTVDLSRGKVVDSSDNFQFAFGNQILQDRRDGKLFDLELDIVFNGLVQITTGMFAAGLDLVIQRTNDTRNGPTSHGGIDGTTAGVSQDVQDLGAQNGGSEFQRSNGFGVDNVSSNTADEDISESLIKDNFDGDAAVGAGQKGGKGSLATFEFLEAFHVAVGGHNVSFDKTLVSCFEGSERLGRSLNVHSTHVTNTLESHLVVAGAVGRTRVAHGRLADTTVGTTSVASYGAQSSVAHGSRGNLSVHEEQATKVCVRNA